MELRITPLSSFRSQPKTNFAEQRNRLTDFNKKLSTKSKQLIISTIPTKRTQTKNVIKHIELSKNITLNRPVTVADKKGLSLYRQVEGNKLFLNGPELVNRFHFKV